MNFFVDDLILVFGLAGAAVLFTGCLVLAGCLLCDGWRAPRSVRPADAAAEGDAPSNRRWLAHLLVVLLGGTVLSILCVWWLWHAVAPARPVLATAGLVGSAREPWRVNLFPWE